jgi:hypothetical protein
MTQNALITGVGRWRGIGAGIAEVWLPTAGISLSCTGVPMTKALSADRIVTGQVPRRLRPQVVAPDRLRRVERWECRT